MAFIVLPQLAAAQGIPLVFERAKITIESPPQNPADQEITPGHSALNYSIERRPESALNLEYIHTLNTLTPTTGVMIDFDSPAIASLPLMKVYTPIDALFIADDGTIIQIFPKLVLGEMKLDVRPREPVKAFLFLKAGEAARSGINPRDIVKGSSFTPLTPTRE